MTSLEAAITVHPNNFVYAPLLPSVAHKLLPLVHSISILVLRSLSLSLPHLLAFMLPAFPHKSRFSISAGKFSFGPVDDMNKIDALTVGVLLLLVLKVGDKMNMRNCASAELEVSSRSTRRTRGEGKTAHLLRVLIGLGGCFQG